MYGHHQASVYSTSANSDNTGLVFTGGWERMSYEFPEEAPSQDIRVDITVLRVDEEDPALRFDYDPGRRSEWDMAHQTASSQNVRRLGLALGRIRKF